jgi:hypothetical protein
MNKWSGLAIKSFIFGLLGWLLPLPIGIFGILSQKATIKVNGFTWQIRKIVGSPAFITILNIICLLLFLFTILLGIRALRNIRSNPTQKGKVFAIIGIALGIIAVLSWMGIIVGLLI